ncbi:LLM class flavin-dependent oxidoreductase [Tenacibaculum mesophilum]|uniref:LLM class flavin-dependent oxidoreductase n=1 Tax=Tenacibaculum mesophilum TaxID=104268 RepID=A0AAE9SF34_9FLAO|nr:LLM class flavin-dependent oxidoreductase [Tenacibaculum mesophilum]UTD15087.1 LLM class flavin-dependent oxidoreductase [Tenacibaculum mesophilum]
MINDILKIGILEFAASNKQNSMHAIEDIFTYACRADELNFSRFWLTEHHRASAVHPYNNPEILMTLIAGMTENIRIGSAGSLIGYYSPYSLAQNYKLLNNIYNNRIDFGLSKGRPENAHQHNFFNLNNSTFENTMYEKNLQAICELLHEEEKKYNESKIVLPPFKGIAPSLWYLSNSYRKKDLAIKNKLNICRSLMHGLDVFEYDEDLKGLQEYKEEYYQTNGQLPEVAIAIAVTFSKTKEQVEQEEKKYKNKREGLKIIPVNKYTFLEKLEKIQKAYGVNEVIICDTEKDIEAKLENLELIKELTTQQVLKTF